MPKKTLQQKQDEIIRAARKKAFWTWLWLIAAILGMAILFALIQIGIERITQS